MLPSARPASPCANLPASLPPVVASGQCSAFGFHYLLVELILLYAAVEILVKSGGVWEFAVYHLGCEGDMCPIFA